MVSYFLFISLAFLQHNFVSIFTFFFRVFEIFGPSILGELCEAEIEVLVQSVFPDEMLKRVVSLDDYAKTLVVQEGVDNQI